LLWASGRDHSRQSPGLLSPLGVIFGLFVAFTAAQVWADNEKARAEIDREASALRNVIILATAFPRESEVELRELVRRYIADATTQEWPMMAQGRANLKVIPGVMTQALQTVVRLSPSSEGQKTAQREIVAGFELRWTHVGSASSSANRKSIWSSGQPCFYRRSALYSQLQ
jgi:hypothetical protein